MLEQETSDADVWIGPVASTKMLHTPTLPTRGKRSEGRTLMQMDEHEHGCLTTLLKLYSNPSYTTIV